jgi:hypothetical protein
MPLSVYVTPHALTRIRDRCPELRRWGRERLIKLVSWEVTEAFQAGRVAKTEPRWTLFHESDPHGSRGRRKQTTRTGRFAWNEERTRAYGIVREKHPRDGRPRVVVRTVFVNGGGAS